MLTKITYPFSNFKSEATLKNLGNCIIPIHKKYNVTKTVMMTSSNGNIFRVTGPSCGEFTDHRWIPPHKGQWGGALMFSLIWAWINDWVNNREAGDLRHHRAHYDVIVMNKRQTILMITAFIISASFDGNGPKHGNILIGFGFMTHYLRESHAIHDLKHQYLPKSSINDTNRLVQERPNSIANALGLRLYCTNPSIFLSVYRLRRSDEFDSQTHDRNCLGICHTPCTSCYHNGSSGKRQTKME